MLINDFNEIENEEDRAIYVQCRQILDAWFLFSQKEHKKKNHDLHDCFNIEMNVGRIQLNNEISKHKITKDELKGMRLDAEQDLLGIFQGIMIIDEKIEVKH